ncbi:hypothetical protein CEXT_106821 [Caerostris extrusa]|uniref:Uncharacterized protein n=1 Tax=Caerostris extrusa TaxID=172846 RepID=A0AAV4SNV5_CAEEX|nr:hypothetical protein CEXT_106821 [Caerostris extrusa]
MIRHSNRVRIRMYEERVFFPPPPPISCLKTTSRNPILNNYRKPRIDPLRYESLRQRNLFEWFIVWDLLDLFLNGFTLSQNLNIKLPPIYTQQTCYRQVLEL